MTIDKEPAATACVKCGHQGRWSSDDRVCRLLSIVFRPDDVSEECGCKCEFTSANEATPERTIHSGGEDIPISDVMQRFRNDGGCEQIIQQALIHLAAHCPVKVFPDLVERPVPEMPNEARIRNQAANIIYAVFGAVNVAYKPERLIAQQLTQLEGLITAALTAAYRSGVPVPCNWSSEGDPDYDEGRWVSDCGNDFLLTEGTPSENKMKFCCYCSKPLTETKTMRIDDDE